MLANCEPEAVNCPNEGMVVGWEADHEAITSRYFVRVALVDDPTADIGMLLDEALARLEAGVNLRSTGRSGELIGTSSAPQL